MSTTAHAASTAPARKPGSIKCVVWDLDDTLWEGTLLEGDRLRVRPEVVAEIRRLDEIGVLHSLASRNDPDAAMAALRAEGLDELFLHPQIGWGAKSAAVARVAKAINVGLDAIAFVDDQPFERSEVEHALPQVLTVDAADAAAALRGPEFTPRFVTDESSHRREMYRSAERRDEVEAEFDGTDEEFLATLGMVFTIAPAQQADLQRAEELTVRTNQLNSTGRTYSYEELDVLRTSPEHLLLVAGLSDRFGSYGKIGLVLVETAGTSWHLRMLLMSCRVMARGVGTVLLNEIMARAAADGAGLRADFVETGRNRMMYITYAFAGFREVERDGDHVLLEADLSQVRAAPGHLTVERG